MRPELKTQLVAILAADAAGYTRLMEDDEERTILEMRSVWSDVFEPIVKEQHGRVVKFMGDGVLACFSSVQDAVRTAVSIQSRMDERSLTSGPAIIFRMGLHMGEVTIEGDDILGEGVNIASRLELNAQPGTIMISDAAYQQVRGRIRETLYKAGEVHLKNLRRPITAWIWNPHQRPPAGLLFYPTLPKDKPALAVLPFRVLGSEGPAQDVFADGLVEDYQHAWKTLQLIRDLPPFGLRIQGTESLCRSWPRSLAALPAGRHRPQIGHPGPDHHRNSSTRSGCSDLGGALRPWHRRLFRGARRDHADTSRPSCRSSSPRANKPTSATRQRAMLRRGIGGSRGST